jgi:hypothetical protein
VLGLVGLLWKWPKWDSRPGLIVPMAGSGPCPCRAAGLSSGPGTA